MISTIYNNLFIKLNPSFITKSINNTKVSSFIKIKNMSSSNSTTPFESPRFVSKKFMAMPQHEGDGAVVRRAIGCRELKSLDPFLMLDHFSVAHPAGFPDHPHRGFETVTYMLEGGITHQDFAGHKGTIYTGDVQWMTAGRGIIHSEMPAGEGTQRGLQLWINLSSQHKMIKPRYQEIQNQDIKRAEREGIEVKIIAGESMGVKSPVNTRTPAMYLDFTLKPEARIDQIIPQSWTAFAYIIEGEATFSIKDTTPIPANHMVVLTLGEGVTVWNKSSKKTLRFVLIAGQPINEPVVQYGPFVMNTQEEIEQAINDYHLSRNGFEMAKYWRSQ